VWFKILFDELGLPISHVTSIYGDSQGAIFNSQNPVTQKGIKHIEIRYHYICEQIEKGTVKIYAINTAVLIISTADMFTKNLGPILFLKHQNLKGLRIGNEQVCALACSAWKSGPVQPFARTETETSFPFLKYSKNRTGTGIDRSTAVLCSLLQLKDQFVTSPRPVLWVVVDKVTIFKYISRGFGKQNPGPVPG